MNFHNSSNTIYETRDNKLKRLLPKSCFLSAYSPKEKSLVLKKIKVTLQTVNCGDFVRLTCEARVDLYDRTAVNSSVFTIEKVTLLHFVSFACRHGME
ncbi:hypothetical protein TNCV_698631, partial [Trichonephila clavipes]